MCGIPIKHHSSEANERALQNCKVTLLLGFCNPSQFCVVPPHSLLERNYLNGWIFLCQCHIFVRRRCDDKDVAQGDSWLPELRFNCQYKLKWKVHCVLSIFTLFPNQNTYKLCVQTIHGHQAIYGHPRGRSAGTGHSFSRVFMVLLLYGSRERERLDRRALSVRQIQTWISRSVTTI